MSKYIVNHPSITPENFSLPLDSKKVKSLYVPYNGDIPQVLYDEPNNSKKTVFQDLTNIQLVVLHPYYHMYVDAFLQVQVHDVNMCVTYMYRNALQMLLGINTSTCIYGDVLLFGSVSAYNEDNDKIDYSISYEVVEQVSRYYDYKILYNVE